MHRLQNGSRKFEMASRLNQRGVWNRKHFSSLEEENAYLKAQVEYKKKRNPNLHGKEWS
jgi:transposase